MYRYIAFIYPPKSTDPVSHAPPHIFVFVFISFCFLFVFVLREKKLKQLPPTTSLRLAPVKRSLESACRLLEIDRATYTVGGCTMIITNYDKPRQTTCFFSSYIVRISEKEKKEKEKKVSHPIPSPQS